MSKREGPPRVPQASAHAIGLTATLVAHRIVARMRGVKTQPVAFGFDSQVTSRENPGVLSVTGDPVHRCVHTHGHLGRCEP